MKNPWTCVGALVFLGGCFPVPGWLECVVLSPECAHSQAGLRVDVVHLPGGTTRVVATAQEQTREAEPPFSTDGITFYFFDLAGEVDVAVRIEGPEAFECAAAGVPTGRGNRFTVDLQTSQCALVQTTVDAGALDSAPPPDASQHDAAVDPHADGGGHVDAAVHVHLDAGALDACEHHDADGGCV